MAMIEMVISKKRIISDSHNTTDIFVVVIMFCIYHAIKGSRKSVEYSYINFCFESVLNSDSYSDIRRVKSWGINKSLKPILIMMINQGLLVAKLKSYKLELSLSDYGVMYVKEMIENSLFEEINKGADAITKKLSTSALKKQNFIW